MDLLKRFLGAISLALVLVVTSSVTVIAADKKDTKKKEAAPKEDGKAKKKGKTAEAGSDGAFYTKDFEEEDDTDAMEASEGSDLEWVKTGANGSKGALRMAPSDKAAKTFGGEKYIAWSDKNTWVEFDVFCHGLTSKCMIVAFGEKMAKNGTAQSKAVEQDKWTHVKIKAKQLSTMDGKTGKGDTFKNLVFYFSVKNAEVEGGPYAIVDNVSIKSYPEGKGPEEAPAETPAVVPAEKTGAAPAAPSAPVKK